MIILNNLLAILNTPRVPEKSRAFFINLDISPTLFCPRLLWEQHMCTRSKHLYHSGSLKYRSKYSVSSSDRIIVPHTLDMSTAAQTETEVEIGAQHTSHSHRSI